VKKLVLGAALIVAMLGTAGSQATSVRSKLRLADAAVEACMANCTNENASCKRVCPTTLSTPCLSACDSQAQTCRQTCQTR